MTAYALAIANIVAGFMLLTAAVDEYQSLNYRNIRRRNLGGAAFWGFLGLVVILNGMRLFP